MSVLDCLLLSIIRGYGDLGYLAFWVIGLPVLGIPCLALLRFSSETLASFIFNLIVRRVTSQTA